MQTLEFVWIRDNCASLVLKKKISQINFDLENFVSILAYKIVPASNISRYLLFIILKFFIFALFFLEKSHWIKVHSNRTASIEHLKMKISANKFFTNQFESDHFFEKKGIYIFSHFYRTNCVWTKERTRMHNETSTKYEHDLK